jgi:hypothetical protein
MGQELQSRLEVKLDEKLDKSFKENNKIFLEAVDEKFVENNMSLLEEVDKKFVENNKVILDAMDATISKSRQEYSAMFEIFTDEVRGLIKDVVSSNSQATSLLGRVETMETVLKTNVLPRLDVLETKVS